MSLSDRLVQESGLPSSFQRQGYIPAKYAVPIVPALLLAHLFLAVGHLKKPHIATNHCLAKYWLLLRVVL